MTSRAWRFLLVVWTLSSGATIAVAQVEPPSALVTRVSTDVLTAVNADPSIQAGDIDRIVALVDAKVLPFLDFERMTATAVGPAWRDATPEQRQALQAEFRTLLVRVYSGALGQAKDRTIAVRPVGDAGSSPEVVVRTDVRGRGDPVELDFRLQNAGTAWRIYDLNVGGVWLVENYRGSFAQPLSSGGIDGLIATLRAKNEAMAKK